MINSHIVYCRLLNPDRTTPRWTRRPLDGGQPKSSYDVTYHAPCHSRTFFGRVATEVVFPFSFSPVVTGSDKLKESYRCEYTYYNGQGNKGYKEVKKSTTQKNTTIRLRPSGRFESSHVSPDDVAFSGVIQ